MKNDIVIYGASTLGKIAYLTLKEDYNICFFCDGDINKIGKSIEGIQILSKDELLKNGDVTVIIASMYYKEIAEELKELGVKKIKIFKIIKYIANFNIKIEQLTTGEYLIADYKKDMDKNNAYINKKNFISIPHNKIKKIAFFSIPGGGDHFLGDIIEQISLNEEYEVKKIIVKNYSQIDEYMKWADICWFEWCDGLIVYASNLEIAKYKKIICRLHYYEAFNDIINNVNWSTVDHAIFVSNFIKNKVEKKLNMKDDYKFRVIPNGINLEYFKYINKKKGYNIAFLAHIDLRKNPMMVIQYFYQLYKKDNRYKLYFGGDIVDEVLRDYLNGVIKHLGIEKNVFFYGKIGRADLNDWFKDKHYIISGSIGEGHPVGIMEAMSCGLKPIIHYFPGIYDFYPENYIYKSFDEFNDIINREYMNQEYREYIEKNFSLEIQMKKIIKLL